MEGTAREGSAKAESPHSNHQPKSPEKVAEEIHGKVDRHGLARYSDAPMFVGERVHRY